MLLCKLNTSGMIELIMKNMTFTNVFDKKTNKMRNTILGGIKHARRSDRCWN